MPRPILSTVCVAALRHNLARVRAAAPDSRIWAVVKADAYGHGLQAAQAGFADADGMALIEFDRAQQLREAGWRKPLLLLEGAFEPADVMQAAQQQLSLVVHQPQQIGWLAQAPAGSIDVFLKINTGMNRLGMPPEQMPWALEKLSTMPAVRSLTWMTHFANADLDGGIDPAMRRLASLAVPLRTPFSLANSAAVLDHPDTHRAWVRPGIMLYGASPFADRTARSLGLLPAMRLSSRLIAIQRLAAGEAVGYGSQFVAPHAMSVGIVACGYADGYPRHAPTGTPIVVAGRRTRTLGRVSMDMLAVDLQGMPSVQVGDEVELWGDTLGVDEVAAHAGTIGYELLCAVAPRVPRCIVGGVG